MIYDAFGNKKNDDGTPISAPISGALADFSNNIIDLNNVSTQRLRFINSIVTTTDNANSQPHRSIITADFNGNTIVQSNDSSYFFDDFGHYLGKFFYTNPSGYGVEINGGGTIQFTSGSVLTDTGATFHIDRTTTVSGDVALDAGKKFQVGTGALTAGINFADASVNTFSINIVGGIVTQFTKNS